MRSSAVTSPETRSVPYPLRSYPKQTGHPGLGRQGRKPQGGQGGLVQDRGEPVRAFAARLRRQAEVCRFVKKCAHCEQISNQGEERVADQLCVGLADAEIQEDLLKHPDQEMGVEETIRFVEVRAAGKRSAVTITTPTSSRMGGLPGLKVSSGWGGSP